MLRCKITYSPRTPRLLEKISNKGGDKEKGRRIVLYLGLICSSGDSDIAETGSAF